MKQFVLKNLLHGLTVLLAVNISFLAAGCGGLNVGNQNINDPFYPEYYAAKKLDSQDIIRLRKYAASVDTKISAPASLILGQYYLKHGDKLYGEFLVDKFYKSPDLNSQMKIFGRLWRIEALMLTNNTKEAAVEVKYLKNIEPNETYIKTLTIFCRQRGLPFSNNDFSRCLDMLAASEKDITPPAVPVVVEPTPIISDTIKPTDNLSIIDNTASMDNITGYDTDNMTYEEYAHAQKAEQNAKGKNLSENREINIVDGDIDGNFIQGMIYAINKFGSDYRINSVASADKWDQRDAVNIKAKTEEIKIGDKVFNISVDWNELVKVAADLKFIENYERIVITAPTNKQNLARNMEKTLKKFNKYVKVLNYSNSSFQIRLREELDRSKDIPILIIGLADGEETLSFVPIAKFLQKDIEKQRILLITGFISNIKNNKEYAGYFRNIYVLTPIQGVNNAMLDKISLDYEGFFGVKMNLANMIGYDSIEFIKNAAGGNKEMPKYLTNIKTFIDYKAYRPAGLYKFDKMLNFTEEAAEMVTREIKESVNTNERLSTNPNSANNQETAENEEEANGFKNIDTEGEIGFQ